MISVLLTVLFASAGVFAVLVLADSAVRGTRAYRILKADLAATSQNEPPKLRSTLSNANAETNVAAPRPRPVIRAIRPRQTVQAPFFARPVAA